MKRKHLKSKELREIIDIYNDTKYPLNDNIEVAKTLINFFNTCIIPYRRKSKKYLMNY